MQHDLPVRRRRWPLVLGLIVVVAAGLWAGGWYYAAGRVEQTVAGWKQREARSGRIYDCGSQSVAGFPFRIAVRCVDANIELKASDPPLSLKTKDIQVTAKVWEPAVLTSEFVGPLTVAPSGQSPTLVAHWSGAQSRVHGTPSAPESISIAVDEPTVDQAEGIDRKRLFTAQRLTLQGRIVQGSPAANPVIEVMVKLLAGSAPTLHAITATPLDADMNMLLHGLTDFSPMPWPARFRALQAAGGRIEVIQARLQQGESIAVAQGALGLSRNGRLDGQLRLTIANLEKLLPALGMDKMLAPQAPPNRMNSALNALDRLSPGLSNIARQNAGPALAAGLSFIGQPIDLEGKRAVALPLRFSDGMVSLGPIPLGQTPPLF